MHTEAACSVDQAAAARSRPLLTSSILLCCPRLFVSPQSGSTALMLACHHGHYDAVVYLLSQHASTNVQDALGWSALMFAAREGHEAIVGLLLADDSDTDVDLTTNTGINALHCAADAGHTQIVRAIIQHGAEINACTNVSRHASAAHER